MLASTIMSFNIGDKVYFKRSGFYTFGIVQSFTKTGKSMRINTYPKVCFNDYVTPSQSQATVKPKYDCVSVDRINARKDSYGDFCYKGELVCHYSPDETYDEYQCF